MLKSNTHTHTHSPIHENVSVESERPPAEETSLEEMRFPPVIIAAAAAVVSHSGPHDDGERRREFEVRVLVRSIG